MNSPEPKRLEDQVRQSQKMEAIGQLADGVAHDFNNLLTVINSYSEMLLASGAFTGEAAEWLKQIYLAGERAAHLTRQLLAVSRQQSVRMQVVDLDEIITNLGQMLRRLIGENITLQLQTGSGPALVLADTGMIEQVVINLAVNARDAMPRGGQLTIRTEIKHLDAAQVLKHPQAHNGDVVCVSVKDTGCGMTDEVKAHLFERFFTTKPLGMGTGLGLAMVLGIVQQHQGWIDCETGVGAGATFTVVLPMAPRSLDSTAPPKSRRVAAGGKEVILVVEDEEPVRTLAVLILQKLGYRVLEAASGAEALEVWERHHTRIDALITDMVMPGDMTGRELAAQLQKLKPSLRVIYTTGYPADLIEEGPGSPERAALLQKPYLPSQLAAALRTVLDSLDPAVAGERNNGNHR